MQNETIQGRFKVLGVNDDRDFCECCGKENLKKVVWIEDTETGEIRHFGCNCALQPVKGFQSDKEIKKALRDWASLEQGAWRAAGREYRAEGGKYTGNLVDGMIPVNQERIQELKNAALVRIKEKNAKWRAA